MEEERRVLQGLQAVKEYCAKQEACADCFFLTTTRPANCAIYKAITDVMPQDFKLSGIRRMISHADNTTSEQIENEARAKREETEDLTPCGKNTT